MAQLSKLQRKLLTIGKVALAVAILGFLLQRIQGEAGFERLLKEPKNWGFLAVALGLVCTAFSLSFVRWFLLVRGLELKFQLRDAFRLGALGYMLNQVSPGSVGGDLLKAVFIAREQPGRKTEAVATVLVDRVIGLYAMLLVASLGLAFAGENLSSNEMLLSLRSVVWVAALCGTAGLALVLSPWATGEKARAFAASLPGGGIITKLVNAADIYRSRRRYLYAGLGLALMTHCFLISAFWSISHGLPVDAPSFAVNSSIVPIALVAGALPLTPGGLGTLEFGLEFLYAAVGAGKGDGTIVALAYRAMTYCFASIGAFYYLNSRKKIEDLIHEAETLSPEL